MNLRLMLLATTIGLCSSSALAHNVLGGVYAIGSQVEGEIGFSNGDMAPAGSTVVISDAKGNQIVSTITDDEGFFTFNATQRIDHYIFSDLGSGHIFEQVLQAEELPDSLGELIREAKASSRDIAIGANSTDNLALQAMIEKAVAKQVKPLRKELTAYKEKASFRDAIGGIGYIFGLCGIGIWLNQRKQQSSKAA